MTQQGAFVSPWPLKMRLKIVLWRLVYVTLFRPTPKPLRGWRVLLLKLFGAQIHGHCYVASSARVRMPWNLIMHDRSCLGENCECYNLTTIELKARCTIAQEVYLCAGTHDFSTTDLPLMVGKIVIGEDAFVGVRALVLPGVVVGDGAVVGGGAVVSKDIEPWTIVAGNPAKVIRMRQRAHTEAETKPVRA